MHLFYIILFLEVFLAVVFFVVSPSSKTNNKTVEQPLQSNYKESVYLILSFGILFFFHAFRDPYSLVDIPEYADAYKEAFKTPWSLVLSEHFYSLKSEVGFRIVIKGLSCLFPSYQMLFVITSGFLIYSFFRATKKYSVFCWMSVLLFLVNSFAESLFILRAFICIGILLFSFPYIIERKILPFLLLNLLAMSIHISSVVFLPVYFLYGINNIKLLCGTFVVSSLFILLWFNSIITYVVEQFLPGYSYYFIFMDNYEGASWKMPALLGFLLIWRIMVLKQSFFENGIVRLFSILSIMAFVIYTAGMGFGLTSRMAMFFTNMTFLILPDTVSRMRNRSLSIFISILYIVFVGYFFLRNSSESLWINYRLIS